MNVTASPLPVNQFAPFDGNVGHFTDTIGSIAAPGDFTASIDWGDGTVTSGTISQPGGVGTVYLVSGTHTYATSGNKTLQVTITTKAEVSPETSTGSNTATVTPQTTTHFTVSAPTSATAGTAFNFTVTALDQFNNTVTGYTGTVHFTSTDAPAGAARRRHVTNGVGTFIATLDTAGSQTITATDTTTIIDYRDQQRHRRQRRRRHALCRLGPASATAGTAFNFTVTALDQFNNTATGYTGTVHFTSTDGQAVLPADATADQRRRHVSPPRSRLPAARPSPPPTPTIVDHRHQ